MLDVKKDIIQFLSGKEDPCSIQGILKGLRFNRGDRQYLKSMLSELVREGKLVKTGSRYWVHDGKKVAKQIKRGKTQSKNEVIGKLSVSSRGVGFVEAPGRDWLIPGKDLKGAQHGDIVRAAIVDIGSGNRRLAEVVEIVEFGINTLLGVFEVGRWGRAFVPFNNVTVDHRNLDTFPKDLKDGMVGVWERGENGMWVFREILGMLDDPKVDEPIALAENEVVSEFSPEVLEAAAQFPENFDFQLGDRRDFREELVFTIDGPDARDFDDALHFKRLGHQMVEVGIHIADVSEFVPEGSILDVWAAEQANSTYLPHKAFPMLPEILSTQLCSLKPGVPRYTLSVVAVMNMSGKVESFEVCKGLIQSSYRLTYDQVATISVDKCERAREQFAEVTPALDLGIKLSRNMRKRRIKAGSLDMDLAEVKIKLDENFELEKVELSYQNDANRMIEAFMVLANECVAAKFEDFGVPFRIHEAPGLKKLKEFADFLSTCGIDAPEYLTQSPGKGLNAVLEKLKAQPNAQVMQTQVLKTLMLAEYNPNNLGHFGLASTHYSHFTSPIRRYADLYTHQRITEILENPELGPEHYDNRRLEKICAHISKKERASMKAEQTFQRIKLLRRIISEVGNEFGGIISDVKSYGLFITLDGWYVSGLVPIEDLDDDTFEFFPDLLAITGRYSGKSYKVGNSVQVKLIRADLVTRRLDLSVVKSTGDVIRPIAKPRGRPLNPKRKKVNRFLKKNKGRGRGKR